MNTTMHITINGNTVPVEPATTVAELIRARGLSGKRLATELNGEILPRSQYETHALNNGDVLEIVGAVGGG